MAMTERKQLAEDGTMFAAVDVVRTAAPGQPVNVEQVPADPGRSA
jgi:hypothetical protein